MANPEHLEILKQGVEVWNEWKEAHRGIEHDFSGAKLEQADLRGAYLWDANFSLADLSKAKLNGVGLNRSKFTYAVLVGADFSGADLTYADLSHANLASAVLRSTKLRGADLSWASLLGADFLNAAFNYTDFSHAVLGMGTMLAQTDLSQVKGLETVVHQWSSEIGISTMYKSRGQIPEIFLRGCGVPETFILQIPALVAAMQPIEFYSCFISYSSKDQEFADRLYADLQNKGVRCWFAPEDLKIGDRFRDRIDESIRLHDKLLLILSENSVSSQWVGDEVEAAFEQEQRQDRTVLFPIRIDDTVMDSDKAWAATVRRTRHVGDFTHWKDHDSYRKAFDRLLRDLKAGA